MKQVIDIVQSILMFGLVAAGIAGLVWRTVKEDGWFGTVFDRLWNAIVDHPVITIPVLIAVGVIGKLWHSYQVEKGYASRLPNLFIYAVMVAGAYFIGHFVYTGSL